MSASESVEYGMIDEVLTKKDGEINWKEKSKKIYSFSKYNFSDAIINFMKAVLSPTIWLFYLVFFLRFP